MIRGDGSWPGWFVGRGRLAPRERTLGAHLFCGPGERRPYQALSEAIPNTVETGDGLRPSIGEVGVRRDDQVERLNFLVCQLVLGEADIGAARPGTSPRGQTHVGLA